MTTTMRGESAAWAVGGAPPASTTGSGRDTPRVAPASFAQERLWFLDQLEPGLAVYNVPRAFHLRGALDVAVLERSINEIVRRHESLRTTFGAVDGLPHQIIAPAVHVRLSVIDLLATPPGERLAHAARCAAEEAAHPFDLSRGPLLRAVLFQLAADEHVLVVTMHHIVSEGGWSMNIFLHELHVLYDAYLQDAASPLPPLPIQYADYAMWQRERLRGEELERELAYWTHQLAGAPAVLELPADRPRPPVQHHRGAVEEMWLGGELAERVRRLSRAEGTTVSMTLLAAWLTVLHRYTGADDLVVGMPIAGRMRHEAEGLIGYFANTLALRVDASGDPTFRQLLAHVRESSLGAFAHQELPFEHLVEALRPERTLDRTPLVQVLFAPQPPSSVVLELSGMVVEPLEVHAGTSLMDATLLSWDEPRGIRLTLEYDTDLFDADRMRRMLNHLRVVVAGVVADPAQQLSALPLLTDAERYQLVVEWNATARSSGHERLIHEVVDAQAARAPDATAVSFEGTELSYAEVIHRANQLARYLRRVGVARGVLVGIAVERSLDMVIGVLGILKAGGAYVPLDPMYPAERLAFMMTDAAIPVLLTQGRLRDRLPDHDGVVVYLDADWDAIAREPRDAPPSDGHPSDVAYVVYTSGSTGRPKGVQVPHRALLNVVLASRELIGATSRDTLLAITTLSFDMAGLEIWLPLATGVRMVLTDARAVRDGARLAAVLKEQCVTIIQATPATWQLLLDSGWTDGCGLKALCGGEALSGSLADRLLATGCTLWNMYGPTETTIWSSAQAVRSSPHRATNVQDTIPIGRPLANTQLYVLDGHGQLVPVGVPGELYIGGVGLADGYLNRCELTRERFVSHPFGAGAGARVYRTGDRVRWRADGTLEFLGRTDRQVKLRGFRIELGEIEAVLRAHPAVRDCVAMMREDVPGERRLVAYVVREEREQTLAEELRAFLRTRLPVYMVPAVVVELATLPVTHNGKVDHRSLPAPDGSRAATVDRTQPRSTTELQLTVLWEELLGIRPVGTHEDFFHLGGHSLLAARLFAEIEQRFGQRLPLATLFRASTISQLARVLDEGRRADWSPLVAIQPRGTKPAIFLVHALGGNVLLYRDLARYLAADRPVYALQAVGLSGTEPAQTSIGAMAARYIMEIRAVQQTGPYYVGGLSSGGLIAFEMALQLQQQGQDMGVVALLDAMLHPKVYMSSVSWARRQCSRVMRRVSWHGRNLLAPPHERRMYLRGVVERVRGRIQSRARRTPMDQREVGDVAAAALHRSVVEGCRTAVRTYQPRRYRGRVVLFRALDRSEVPVDAALGWDRWVDGGVEIRDVPGGHVGMLSPPHVMVLADELTRCLTDVHTARGRCGE